jgi:hypothetical protein
MLISEHREIGTILFLRCYEKKENRCRQVTNYCNKVIPQFFYLLFNFDFYLQLNKTRPRKIINFSYVFSS